MLACQTKQQQDSPHLLLAHDLFRPRCPSYLLPCLIRQEKGVRPRSQSSGRLKRVGRMGPGKKRSTDREAALRLRPPQLQPGTSQQARARKHPLRLPLRWLPLARVARLLVQGSGLQSRP